MENNRNILKEYEELTAAEKEQVDALVDNYKSGRADMNPYTVLTAEVTDDEGNVSYTGNRTVGAAGAITTADVMNYISKFSEHINEVNDKLDKTEKSHNKMENEMRMQLFEDRWRRGYYNQNNRPTKATPVNTSNDDVKQLKQEVSDLKQGMNDIINLLKEKLK